MSGYFRVTQKQSGGGGGATITVSYGSLYYSKTITCSNGTTTYTATTTSSGSTTFNVNAEGTWTITCNGKTTSVNVVLEYEASLAPDGSTVLPTDDVQIWLECAGITGKSYTTLNEVLADSTTLLALMSDNNAVDYLVRSSTWITGITEDATAMTDIGANDYCAEKLLSNAAWRAGICSSTYFEDVLDVKVPNMTSNTAPSGTVSCSNSIGAYYGWKAFNSDDANGWIPSSDVDPWIQYDFETSVQVNKVTTKGSIYGALQTFTAKIQGSNDGSVFQDIYSNITVKNDGVAYPFVFENNNKYRYYRLAYLSKTSSTYNINYGSDFQFYGRE